MNSPSLTAERDPGHDGIASADPNRHFAADASAYGLQYHLQDYTPVVPTAPDPLPALTGGFGHLSSAVERCFRKA